MRYELKWDEVMEIKMHIPADASLGTYEVLKTGDYEYQMMHNDPFSDELLFGVFFEVEKEMKDDAFVFKRISRESDFKTDIYLRPMNVTEADQRKIGDMIMQDGGFWEVLFGGIVYVSLRKDSTFDVFAALKKLIDENKEGI